MSLYKPVCLYMLLSVCLYMHQPVSEYLSESSLSVCLCMSLPGFLPKTVFCLRCRIKLESVDIILVLLQLFYFAFE